MDARTPDLTLAVIMRDEADRIGGLLRRHAGIWDEAVVVDTGSRDGSVGVARGAGARVIPFPWCDDFSAARNHGLEACRGRWILVLDCDEHLDPEGLEEVGRLAAGPADRAYACEQRNYTDETGVPGWRPSPGAGRGYVPVTTIRLFPRMDTMRYSGRIHETLEGSLAEARVPVEGCGAVVHHEGHADDPARRRARLRRDGELLRSELRIRPRDPRTRVLMAVQLEREGRPDLAAALLERALADAPTGPDALRGRRLLGRLRWRQGRTREAAREFESVLREAPELAGSWLDAARAAVAVGDRARARRLAESGAGLFPLDAGLRQIKTQVFAKSADQIGEM